MIRPLALILSGILCCSCVWDVPSENQDNLVLDDSEYPYAGIPRLVVETENFRQIRNRETTIPAHLQIYGESSPKTEILDLTVKGRGNSSFTGMPKWSIKLKFKKKQDLLGMPKDKEWALIANSADKTLLKNFITYKLAWWLGDEYSPRAQFVELYFNRKYMGVYLLVETIKVSKNRVDLPEGTGSFLLERGPTEKGDEHFVITEAGTTFCINYPKEPDFWDVQTIKKKLSQFENFITNPAQSSTPIDSFIDVEDYLRFYWIQELSKNLDGAFRRSIFITWQKDDVLRMGPIWDFDVAYGNWTADSLRHPYDWYIRSSGWNGLFFNNIQNWDRALDYWKKKHSFLETLPDSIYKYSNEISAATKNEFKRWPVLSNTENWTYKEAYKSHDEAVDSLTSWIRQRINWIDNHL